MAVIKRGILGGFQNKIANVVGSSWKGIATMRSLPISVANPRTAPQLEARSNFSMAAKVGSSILTSIIKPLWDRFAQQESGYNAWLRANVSKFTGGMLTDPAGLIFSRGTLAVSPILTSVADISAQTLTLTWDATVEGDASPTDLAYVVFYGGLNEFPLGYAAVAPRSAGTVVVPISGNLPVGDTYYSYLMFRRADGTRVSNTDHFFGNMVA